MADTRINALSTATSSVGDDFVPIDGTTNGTRKLSAYSPTFGGNLTVSGNTTVGGLLTVSNGANIALGDGLALQTAGSASVRWQDAGVSKWWIYKLSTDTQLYFRDMVNARMQMVMQPGATSSAALTSIYSGVAIDSTTASTSTSSGALVVSGGVGVAGAIFAGGNIQSNAVFAANNTTLYLRPSGASVSSGQVIIETSGNITASGDLQFAANNTYDVGSSTNQIRAVHVRDLFVGTATPASASATGTAGQITWDASYIYVCTGTNQWKRVAIATW